MEKSEKILKICLIGLITLTAIGAMTCFAFSTETDSSPAALISSESIRVSHEETAETALSALNEIETYLGFLEMMDGGNLALLSSADKEFENPEDGRSDCDGDASLTILNELAPYRGWMLWIEPSLSEDPESPDLKPVSEAGAVPET